MSKRIAIIGGGISGLAAAYHLKRRAQKERLDISCVLFERDSRLGGKIRTHREGGFVMEEGPDSILARKPAGVGLIRELGLESEMVGSNPAAMKTYIFHKGKLESIPPGTNMGVPAKFGPFASTALVSWPGKLRALFDLVLPKSEVRSDVALGAFLRRRLGDEVVNHVVEPLVAGVYAGSVDELSLRATFPQYLELEQKYRSLILGSIRQRRQVKARQPEATAGTRTAQTSTGRSAFVTLNNGLQTIVERLYDELHTWAELHVNTSVEGVARRGSGQYELKVVDANGPRAVEADAVIVCTPAHVAADLLAPLCETAERLRSIPYISTAVVLLGFHRESLPAGLDGAGFVVPRTEGRNITACTFTSSKWPHTAPKGQVLVRCYVGRAGQQEVLSQSDEEMVETVRAELRDILGISATPWFTRVVRWNHAMPQYRVGHLELVTDMDKAIREQVPGVFLAGAGYRGVGIPDCIQDGTNAADRAIEHVLD
jgi:oxygen-dependent protoporphyrinogen oxidase